MGSRRPTGGVRIFGWFVSEAGSVADTPPSLSAADRLQPLLLVGSIGAGLALSRLTPGPAGMMGWLVPAGVFALIYLVILGLAPAAIATAMSQRRFLTIAVVVNFVVNPVIAWALGAVFLSGQPDLRVGLVLFLVTPCIGWYLVFTELAGGDVGLGISLLGLNAVLQILLLPAYLLALTGRSVNVDIGTVLGSVATFLVLPAVAAGVTRFGLRRWQRGPAAPLAGRWIDRAKMLLVTTVVVAMFAANGQIVLDNPEVVAEVAVPMITFFALAFALAVMVGRRARLPYEQAALLVFTSTSRNSEASLAIAATAFASPLVGLTVVIGPVIELPLLVLMVRLVAGAIPAR